MTNTEGILDSITQQLEALYRDASFTDITLKRFNDLKEEIEILGNRLIRSQDDLKSAQSELVKSQDRASLYYSRLEELLTREDYLVEREKKIADLEKRCWIAEAELRGVTRTVDTFLRPSQVRRNIVDQYMMPGNMGSNGVLNPAEEVTKSTTVIESQE